MKYYTPAEVAEILRLPAEWDQERWVRARCKSGEIKAKRISRGVWRISERAVADFMAPREETPSVATDAVEAAATAVVDGLSARARRRARSFAS